MAKTFYFQETVPSLLKYNEVLRRTVEQQDCGICFRAFVVKNLYPCLRLVYFNL